jgi:hypothetical protein
MPLILLPKGTYVYLTEPCREALIAEDGTFSAGREILKGTVLQSLENFPKPGKLKDLVKYRVARVTNRIVGTLGMNYKSDIRVNKDDEVFLYMREVFQFLKADSSFQEEVDTYEEGKKGGIIVAGSIEQAMDIFVNGEDGQ